MQINFHHKTNKINLHHQEDIIFNPQLNGLFSSMHLAYIGTADSFFTKKFIPALQSLKHDQLSFICIRQNEFSIKPGNPTFLFNLILVMKDIRTKFIRLSSRIYWQVYCMQHRITFRTFKTVNLEDVPEYIRDADFILTAGLREKISTAIYEATKNGIVNFHYSLLPKYRGTNPVFWQKVNADFNFGYTFHKINDKIDCGEILFQQNVNVNPSNPVAAICDILTTHAANNLFRLTTHQVKSTMQDEQAAIQYNNQDYNHYLKLSTQDSGLSWSEKCKNASLFILNDRWIIKMTCNGPTRVKNRLDLNGKLTKDGYSFEFKKINYLPPVFYYFFLKKHFE